jgi:hypothetical protein
VRSPPERFYRSTPSSSEIERVLRHAFTELHTRAFELGERQRVEGRPGEIGRFGEHAVSNDLPNAITSHEPDRHR